MTVAAYKAERALQSYSTATVPLSHIVPTLVAGPSSKLPKPRGAKALKYLGSFCAAGDILLVVRLHAPAKLHVHSAEDELNPSVGQTC